LLQLKWSINKYIPFLVIDPEEDASPEPVDSEGKLAEVGSLTIPKSA